MILIILVKDNHKGLVINYGEGGYRMEKLRVQNFLRPTSRQNKTFQPPPPLFFKGGHFFAPPPPTPAISMAKTSSSCVNYIILCCPKGLLVVAVARVA